MVVPGGESRVKMHTTGARLDTFTIQSEEEFQVPTTPSN
jgi:hypothetical protein